MADERDVAAAVERLRRQFFTPVTSTTQHPVGLDVLAVCDALAQAQRENAQLREQIGVYRRALSHNGLDY